jgi:hypothetical protein
MATKTAATFSWFVSASMAEVYHAKIVGNCNFQQTRFWRLQPAATAMAKVNSNLMTTRPTSFGNAEARPALDSSERIGFG